MRAAMAKIAGAALVVLLAFSLAGCAGLPKSAPIAAMPVVDQLHIPGISTTPSAEVSKIDTAQAIAAAGKADGLNLSGPASGLKVTAHKVRFTAEHTSPSLIPRNVLAWVITVDGVKQYPSGAAHVTPGQRQAPPKPNTQLIIVIDANTSAFLQDVTYK
jgi:hypothetical protein